MKIPRLLSTLFILTATSLSVFAADPAGTWKFKAEGPGGRSVDSTLTLKLENHQLTGTIENRAGKTEIRDGQFANDQLSFTVVREIGRRLRKKTFTVSYRGKLEGDTITGTIQTTGREKQPITVPWAAQRTR